MIKQLFTYNFTIALSFYIVNFWFYGSKLREIHVVQLMLAELLGPKPPATVTILSLFLKEKEITHAAESFPYSWETNLRKLETPQVEIVSDTIYRTGAIIPRSWLETALEY